MRASTRTAVGLLAALALLTAACSSNSSSSVAVTTTAPPDRGPVDVLYAGSLTTAMENDIGPAFTKATGYRFSGYGAGSTALASAITGKVRQGDVFISASPAVNATLEGAANGSWVSWYAAFATAPLVLGYNPTSSFAADLKTTPWYQVVTRPGFLLGRTDPVLDPKGKLTATAITDTVTSTGDSALLKLLQGTAGVFPEETLVGRLQAGQLDAGFFYANEAKAAGIPNVPLGTVSLSATFTVTVLAGAPHEAGAEAFVAYLLGTADGKAELGAEGLALVTPPTVSGTGVPASLTPVLGTS